jgi:hypothetical protein
MGRARAAVAAGAAGHDARQDEGHAGDPEHVGTVPSRRCRMRMAARRRHMNGDVRDPGDGHEGKADEQDDGQVADPTERLYHQHAL